MLMYRRTNSLEVIGYSDADFAGCVDSRKSTSSYINKLANGVVSWRSEKCFVLIRMLNSIPKRRN